MLARRVSRSYSTSAPFELLDLLQVGPAADSQNDSIGTYNESPPPPYRIQNHGKAFTSCVICPRSWVHRLRTLLAHFSRRRATQYNCVCASAGSLHSSVHPSIQSVNAVHRMMRYREGPIFSTKAHDWKGIFNVSLFPQAWCEHDTSVASEVFAKSKWPRDAQDAAGN